MQIECEKCKKNFKSKFDLGRHLNKKYPCDIQKPAIKDPENIICEFCNKKYSNKYGLYKHFKTCTKKIIAEEVLKEKKIIEQNTIINIENQTNNQTNNLNITNNIINNVVMTVDYSKENLADVDLMNILMRHEEVIVKFLYELHCSEEKPEYYNVGIKNMKRYQAYVKQNGLWIERNKKEVLNELLVKISNFISDEHDKECKRVGLNKANLLFSNALREIKYTDPTEAIFKKAEVNKLQSDIEYVLFSNKDKIFSNKKQIIKNKYNYQLKVRPEMLKINLKEN